MQWQALHCHTGRASVQVKELQSEDSAVKQQALCACVEQLQAPLAYPRCLQAGVCKPLVTILQQVRPAVFSILMIFLTCRNGCH